MTARSFVLSCMAAVQLGCASQPPLPAAAIALNDEGIASLAAGNLEIAGARFKLALEYNPRFVEALCNLALVELELGNFSRAKQLLMRSRRINEDIAQPHHALGVLSQRLGQHDDASTHFRAALAVDPGFAPSRIALARLLFEGNQLHHAKLEFEKLSQVAPDLPAAHAGLAETLIRLGRRREAEKIIAKQVPRFPDSAELQLLLARTELSEGKVEKAVARLTPLSRMGDPTAALALSWLAVAEVLRRRPRHAIGAARGALSLDRESTVARHAMFLALELLEDPRAEQYKTTPP